MILWFMEQYRWNNFNECDLKNTNERKKNTYQCFVKIDIKWMI